MYLELLLHTIGAFLLTVELLCVEWEVRLISNSTDCKQRSSPVSKTTPTVSAKAYPIFNSWRTQSISGPHSWGCNPNNWSTFQGQELVRVLLFLIVISFFAAPSFEGLHTTFLQTWATFVHNSCTTASSFNHPLTLFPGLFFPSVIVLAFGGISFLFPGTCKQKRVRSDMLTARKSSTPRGATEAVEFAHQMESARWSPLDRRKIASLVTHAIAITNR